MGDKIYDLLVKFGNAPESWRENFVSWFNNEFPGKEYHFSSDIGPGSKVYLTRDRWYVDYYQEFKETPEKLAAKEAINKGLVELHKENYR